mmetsp:Transcript_95392/g.199577  ORF Transcript_95392/g.199577 Transcript_95392/m.199577 type:complete len:117 (-) Transcript_95392:960-1310(-)
MVFRRRWAREKARTVAVLKEFDVGNCICAVEADREIVCAKIADLMRVVHQHLRNASTAEALEAFNNEVRVKVPVAFDCIFGVVTLRYRHMVFIALTTGGSASADYAVFNQPSYSKY